jgi:hypothetical protein
MFFRIITEDFGIFLSTDKETRNRTRLDVARVKLFCPLLRTIDRVIPVIVLGVSTVVRVMVERGRVEEDDRSFQDDQLRWSVATSSCKSFDQGPREAVVDESVMGESDSDVSGGGQMEERGAGGIPVDLYGKKKDSAMPFVEAEPRCVILSTQQIVKGCEGDITVGVSGGTEGI